MEQMSPESRTERLTISVTPREKLAVQLAAAKHRTDVSSLLRERLLVGVLEEAEKIRTDLDRAGLPA
jgi:uncharacterized protein (DUF1778 family)